MEAGTARRREKVCEEASSEEARRRAARRERRRHEDPARQRDHRKGPDGGLSGSFHIVTDISKFKHQEEDFQPRTHCVELADGTRCV